MCATTWPVSSRFLAFRLTHSNDCGGTARQSADAAPTILGQYVCCHHVSRLVRGHRPVTRCWPSLPTPRHFAKIPDDVLLQVHNAAVAKRIVRQRS